MKIFTTPSIREIDAETIANEGISSIDLMERASQAVACEIMTRWLPNRRIVVFAGPGKNGGDALAVARILVENGYKVESILFNVPSSVLSEECEINRDRLLAIDNVDFTEVVYEFSQPYLGKNDIVIDGLFGSGLREPLKGGFTSLVQFINESPSFVVSIDVPSGLLGEWNIQNDRRNIIKADLTLTFQFKRLSFFFSENQQYLGECKVMDIDLCAEAIKKATSDYYEIEARDVKRVIQSKRKDYANKYEYGSVLMVAGSYGMMGAAVLATRGAMRAGAGVVSIHSPRCGYTIMQTSTPEALFLPDKHDIVVSNINVDRKYNAIAVGPGLGKHDLTVDAIDRFLKTTKEPCVLDADALNCISERAMLLESIPPMSVITPHAVEFDRLFGSQENEEVRLRKAIEVSQQYKIIIVLKGHNTMTIRPDGKVYINSSGNSGMATAGSGDVLTGIIASFVAQGYSMEISAWMGVYVHGFAGDKAALAKGTFGMIASDIIENTPLAIKEIMMK